MYIINTNPHGKYFVRYSRTPTHSLQNLTHSSDTSTTLCTYTVHTYFPWTFLHILTSSSITITFKNGMHLRKLSSAQMPAKTQLIRLCHVKGSSRLDGPARNFHLSMLVFNALLSIMGDKISCTLCPKLKGLSDVLPTSKREWSYPFPTPSMQCYASGDVCHYGLR